MRNFKKNIKKGFTFPKILVAYLSLKRPLARSNNFLLTPKVNTFLDFKQENTKKKLFFISAATFRRQKRPIHCEKTVISPPFSPFNICIHFNDLDGRL